MRSTLTFLFSFLLLQSPAAAECFKHLSRPSTTNYQPIPICPPSELFNCLLTPPLVLIFDFPRETLGTYLDSSLTASQLSSTLRQLVQTSIDKKEALRYFCRSLPLKPFNLYDCFLPSDTKTPIFTSVSFFELGLVFPSRSKHSFYHMYRPGGLPGYFAEYNCHPQNSKQIQLRQYHWGDTKKEYIEGQSVLFSNYTGTSSLVLKISTLSKKDFLQKSSKKKLGFTIDPNAPRILYQHLVPENLKY